MLSGKHELRNKGPHRYSIRSYINQQCEALQTRYIATHIRYSGCRLMHVPPNSFHLTRSCDKGGKLPVKSMVGRSAVAFLTDISIWQSGADFPAN